MRGLREALLTLRTDLHECYPDRAQYDIPSTVIDRLDAILTAHPQLERTCGKTGERGTCVFVSSHQAICRNANGLGIGEVK